MSTGLHLPANFLSRARSLLSPLTKYRVKPILANVRLDAKDGKVRMFATNLSSAATIHGECDSSGETSVLLPADQLFGFAAQNAKLPLQISLNGSGKATLSAASTKMSLPTADPKEFPTPLAPSGEPFPIQGAALRSACRVAFACDSEASRYALGGPAITFHEGMAHLSASDGSRGAVHRLGAAPENIERESVPMSREAFGLFASLPDGECAVSIGKSAVTVDCPEMTVTVLRVEGRFPRIHEAISKPTGSVATINPESLLQLIAPTTLLYEEDSKSCDLTFDLDSISAAKSGSLGDASGTTPAKCSGKAMASFNSKFLSEALRSFDSGSITLVDAAMDDYGKILFSTEGAETSYWTALMPLARDAR